MELQGGKGVRLLSTHHVAEAVLDLLQGQLHLILSQSPLIIQQPNGKSLF
jgi:hypothetical protein